MSGHEDARYLSSRWPDSAEGTLSDREPAEEYVSEVTAAPVDPKSTTTYRLALGAVIGLGVLLLIGVVVLVIGLARGWGHSPPPVAAAPAQKTPVTMSLAPGYRILSSDTQPGRLILHVRSEKSDEIWVIDTSDGHIVAVIHGEPPK